MGLRLRRSRAIPAALTALLLVGTAACRTPPGGWPGRTTTTTGSSGTTTTTGSGTTTTGSGTTTTTGSSGTTTTTTGTPGPAPTFGAATTVVQGMQVPWSIVWPDRDTMIVTERPGRFRVVANGQLRAEPIGTVQVIRSGEGGLMGIALHPQWPQQRFLYAYYTAPSGNRLVRFPVAADLTLGAEQRLLPEIPEGVFHDGGYIAFGPDGMLYVASGDGTNPPAASDRNSLNGKILRVTPEGTVPADNPFPGSYVWSWGHRNPQGLAWDAEGRLYAAEHGPTVEQTGLCCNDELNLIEKGGYYGWPYFAGNTRTTILTGTPPATVIPPIATSGNSETWAPSAVALYDAADGTTHLYQAELRGAKVRHFTINKAQPSTIVRTENEVTQFGRLRASVFGPDGCHYLTSSNRDSRGTPRTGDDRIIRRCPT